MANNQTHDVHPSLTEMNNDESKSHLQSIIDKNSSDTNREDYNKTVDQNQSIASSFDATSESSESGNVQIDATSSKIHPYNKLVKHTVQDHSQTEDDSKRQRTLSSSSSSSSSSDNQTSNIPYELLNNDEDDDDDRSEHKKETS